MFEFSFAGTEHYGNHIKAAIFYTRAMVQVMARSAHETLALLCVNPLFGGVTDSILARFHLDKHILSRTLHHEIDLAASPLITPF